MMSRWNWASRRAKVLLVLVLAWTLAGCGRRAPTLALPVALPFDTITVEQTSPPAAVVLQAYGEILRELARLDADASPVEVCPHDTVELDSLDSEFLQEQEAAAIFFVKDGNFFVGPVFDSSTIRFFSAEQGAL